MRAMWIVAIFFLGIGNFALHKAVLESGHPLVKNFTGPGRRGIRQGMMAGEFVALLTALLLVANGYPQWGWVYLGYSMFNALTGWMVLTRRI